MGVKPDHWIVRMARDSGMIEPFEASQVSSGKISYGPSSYGYDFRVDRHFKVFRGENSDVLDPKQVDPELFEDFENDSCVIAPHNFILAQSF